MWENIMTQAMTNGIWACLFVALLVFVLKDSKSREERYLETVKSLSTSLKIVGEIKEDIGGILVLLQEIVYDLKAKKPVSLAKHKRQKAQEDTNDATIHIEY